jgi:hypothetical protein
MRSCLDIGLRELRVFHDERRAAVLPHLQGLLREETTPAAPRPTPPRAGLGRRCSRRSGRRVRCRCLNPLEKTMSDRTVTALALLVLLLGGALVGAVIAEIAWRLG